MGLWDPFVDVAFGAAMRSCTPPPVYLCLGAFLVEPLDKDPFLADPDVDLAQGLKWYPSTPPSIMALLRGSLFQNYQSVP